MKLQKIVKITFVITIVKIQARYSVEKGHSGLSPSVLITKVFNSDKCRREDIIIFKL